MGGTSGGRGDGGGRDAGEGAPHPHIVDSH